MKETKTLLLENDEVDEYNNLIKRFDNEVEKGIKDHYDRILPIKKFGHNFLMGWLGLFIGLIIGIIITT